MAVKVGMIGMGIMGSAIAKHLVKTGYEVFGYDVDDAKNAAMSAEGVTVGESPADVASRCEVAFTSLPTVAAFDEVTEEIASSGNKGLVVFECSTFPIADKERNRARLEESGVILMDCPLSGTGSQAEVGDLSVYVSGEKSGYDRYSQIFDCFSRSNYYLGAFGNGSRMKFVANLLVAVHNVSTAEAFVLGMKSGLDPDTILKVITDGAGNSRMFEVRGPMMAKNDYTGVTMSMKMWQKDMKIIQAFAHEIGAPIHLLSACDPIYKAGIEQGLEAQDTASVCAVLEKEGNFKR